ncbi:MAG: TRAP transporter TatT component family protein [Myxococcota bacterium]
MRLLSITVLLVALLAGGCSARQSAICTRVTPAPTAEGDADALAAEAEAAWEQRGDEAKLREAIEKWERALAVDPTRASLRVRVARARYFLAEGHLRFRDDTGGEMRTQFRESTEQAERALARQYPRFRTRFCARQPFGAALRMLDEEAVPAMYWYAVALGRYARATSVVQVLEHKDRIEAMMELILDLDPAYFHWAADRYLGAYYTAIPIPNGDLERSARHFEKSMAEAPEYLATRVLYAELNAIEAGRRDLFERLLTGVLDFDLSEAPEIAPDNEAAQRRARGLLESIDVHFP